MFQSAESRYNQWVRDHYRFLLRSAWAMTGSRRGVQRSVVALLLFGSGVGGVLAMRPPELVRGAIEHENHERTLRGQPGGQTLVLVAEQKKALAIAHAQFARQPG